MRGFSSAFPDGASGIGLVLLRISVLLSLCEIYNPAGAGLLLTLLWGATALLLASGFLTPLAAAACLVWSAGCLASSPRPDPVWLGGAALSALALGLLGPGAYSADARLFGRRRLFAPDWRER